MRVPLLPLPLGLVAGLGSLLAVCACSSIAKDLAPEEELHDEEKGTNRPLPPSDLTCLVYADEDTDGACAPEIVTEIVYGSDEPQPSECLRCRSLDCDDSDPTVSVVRRVDRDRDGHLSPEVMCAAPQSQNERPVLAGDDCDDSDPSRKRLLFRDEDGDGYGQGAGLCLTEEQIASDPAIKWVPFGGDCDDADSLVNPSAVWTSRQSESRDCADFDVQCEAIDSSAEHQVGTRLCAGPQLSLAGDETCNPPGGDACPKAGTVRWVLRILNIGSDVFEGDVRIETTEEACLGAPFNRAQARNSSVACAAEPNLVKRVHVFSETIEAGAQPFVVSLESVDAPSLLNVGSEICPEARGFPAQYFIHCR